MDECPARATFFTVVVEPPVDKGNRVIIVWRNVAFYFYFCESGELFQNLSNGMYSTVYAVDEMLLLRICSGISKRLVGHTQTATDNNPWRGQPLPRENHLTTSRYPHSAAPSMAAGVKDRGCPRPTLPLSNKGVHAYRSRAKRYPTDQRKRTGGAGRQKEQNTRSFVFDFLILFSKETQHTPNGLSSMHSTNTQLVFAHGIGVKKTQQAGVSVCTQRETKSGNDLRKTPSAARAALAAYTRLFSRNQDQR